MSHHENHIMPPGLRERLQQKTEADRESIERVWDLLGEAGPPGEVPNADDTWAELERRLFEEERPRVTPVRRTAADRTARRRAPAFAASSRWLAAAAVVAVIAVGALLWWSVPVTVTVPPGAKTVVSLPDGSSVELGGGSSVAYQRGFSRLPLVAAGTRSATVEGEAFFHVKQAERPFIVETFNARVEVIGTRFDVQAWSGMTQPETRVTLASGLLRVVSKSVIGGQGVTLQEAGHTSRVVGVASAPTPPQLANIDQVLAWRQEGFYALDQPLSAILARLEHRFGIEIVLLVPSAAADAMTLYYSQQIDLETILDDICMAKGLAYRRTSRGYEIIAAGRAGETDHI